MQNSVKETTLIQIKTLTAKLARQIEVYTDGGIRDMLLDAAAAGHAEVVGWARWSSVFPGEVNPLIYEMWLIKNEAHGLTWLLADGDCRHARQYSCPNVPQLFIS